MFNVQMKSFTNENMDRQMLNRILSFMIKR